VTPRVHSTHEAARARPHELRLRRLGAGWGDDEVRAQLFPLLALRARQNRLFLARAVTWLAGHRYRLRHRRRGHPRHRARQLCRDLGRVR
jgi:hypothetical protein